MLAIRVAERRGAQHFLNLVWDRTGGHIVLHAVHVWIMYLAIEPYVRCVGQARFE